LVIKSLLSLTLASVLTISAAIIQTGYRNPLPEGIPASFPDPQAAGGISVYLPLIVNQRRIPRVNAPFFNGEIAFEQTAIFWFGQVTTTDNYADVRVAYNAQELWVYLAAFDRRLWYDPQPNPNDLESWDAVTLYLSVPDISGGAGDRMYRFVGQLNWFEAREEWQAAYQKTGSGWQSTANPFVTETAWAGYPMLNDDANDRGWWIKFTIPFTSLGLSGAPQAGEGWRMAVKLHDRDNASGPPLPEKIWPSSMGQEHSDTWGLLYFGLPIYTPPGGVVPGQLITIRHGLNGAVVKDGMVGGGSVCGQGLDYWTAWGQKNYAGSVHVDTQNEQDISDWPCFSKVYITFPLDKLPHGQDIYSATLTLSLMGNAGGGEWGPAADSFVQVLTVSDDWSETTLSWNNAPLAMENVSRAWVYPIVDYPGDPGIPYQWDLGYAVKQAYDAGTPLRLAIYTSDGYYNTGKYFNSSDIGDWGAVGRPTLQVRMGNR